MPHEADARATTPATVFLVGAGPGDPNLITLRGVQCLRRADVVLYDYLANAQILKHVRPEAVTECLGKHGQTRIWPQDEINQRLIALARQGKTVVRLKGGDPAIFARAAEECGALEDAGIPYEVVPGITAALAAGSCANAPITHRDHASAVAFFTGQQHADAEEQLDFAALAAFPGTLVVYMGVSSADYWTSRLMEHGKAGATPTVIIRRCSFSDQTKHVCRLDEVATYIQRRRLRPPAVIIVGQVAQAARAASWFERRPLFGVAILISRPASQNEALAELLESQGAEVLQQPAIRIGPPQDWAPLDAALTDLTRYDWLVFSSSNGVHFFLRRLLQRGDLRRLGGCRLAAIGPGTAAALAEYHLHADATPADDFRAEGLAAALAEQATAGRRFLLLRASRGREVLAESLAAVGGQVTQVVVYESQDVAAANPEILARLNQGRIDWLTVTSSAIARSLHSMLGPKPPQCKIASISPITSGTLRELGWPVDAEAVSYTMPGIVDAIAASVHATQKGRDE